MVENRMTLVNFLMSSETREKLRRQTRFVSNLVPGELYKTQEVQCCLEYLNRDKNNSRMTLIYSDEYGNKYFFLKPRRCGVEGKVKYLNSTPREDDNLTAL